MYRVHFRLEAFYSPLCVNEFHLASEEWVTCRADVHRKLLLRGASGERITARARHNGVVKIGRMDVSHKTRLAAFYQECAEPYYTSLEEKLESQRLGQPQ